MPEAKLDPIKRLAAALTLRGLHVHCVSAWGTLREVVLHLRRAGSDVQICWSSAEPRPDLCVSMRHLIDAVPGLHLKRASDKQALCAVDEERAFALVFEHEFVLQLQASDQQTAQEVCRCLNALAKEVAAAQRRAGHWCDDFGKLGIQLVRTEERLIQFQKLLRKQESCQRIACLLQGAARRQQQSAICAWIAFIRKANERRFLEDRHRWHLHAVCNAQGNFQAWYHATFSREVYREPRTFWHTEAVMYAYEHSAKRIRIDEAAAGDGGAALQQVLCTDGTTYSDVAAQMYIMKAILPHAQYQRFQHLATEGVSIVKHPRKGWPGSRPFRLSFIEGEMYLTWNSRQGHQGIPLREVRQLSTGINTPVLHRTGNAEHRERYLSLVTTERSLDLCFATPEERQLWQDIFQTLIDKENNDVQSLQPDDDDDDDDASMDADHGFERVARAYVHGF